MHVHPTQRLTSGYDLSKKPPKVNIAEGRALPELKCGMFLRSKCWTKMSNL